MVAFDAFNVRTSDFKRRWMLRKHHLALDLGHSGLSICDCRNTEVLRLGARLDASSRVGRRTKLLVAGRPRGEASYAAQHAAPRSGAMVNIAHYAKSYVKKTAAALGEA